MMILQRIRAMFRREDGATAVEFALLATPLFLLLFGLIEMCMIFTKQGILEYATSQAARKIRTGQAQESGSPEDFFKQALCDSASFLLSCDDIAYEVQSLGSFGEADEQPEPGFDENGNFLSQGFDSGGSNGVVMIRTVYRHELFTPMMSSLMNSPGENGKRLMISTVVLQSEPYEFNY